jgi:hypothetical protein
MAAAGGGDAARVAATVANFAVGCLGMPKVTSKPSNQVVYKLGCREQLSSTAAYPAAQCKKGYQETEEAALPSAWVLVLCE